MLWTIFALLPVLWLLGIVSANTFGGFIHVLPWVAIAVVLLRVLQGAAQPELSGKVVDGNSKTAQRVLDRFHSRGSISLPATRLRWSRLRSSRSRPLATNREARSHRCPAAA